MRPVLFTTLLFLCLSTLTIAQKFEVRVLDPNSVAVSGARVIVYSPTSNTPIAAQNTSGGGIANFNGIAAGDYRIEILAAGFAPQTVTSKLPNPAGLDVALKLARHEETVVVTTSESPLPIEESGAQIGRAS